ncbi:MAG TPA: PQQ-binding-like beta-propeller repeat protein [Mucilaginibacter sp.]|jgi:outer membrane protein assembly factor BamB|nr:PQQ-binding-like beta-propeller repeat protein [Mucilaginibacter sp.]
MASIGQTNINKGVMTIVCFLAVLLVKAQKAANFRYAMFQASETHTGVYPPSKYNTLGILDWKFRSNGKIFSSPAVWNGMVYIGSEDHYLYAIDSKSGKSVWKFKTGGAVDSSPAVYENVIYFGSFDGYFYALNARTGSLLWRFKTGGEKLIGYKGLWGMTPKDLYMEDQYDFYLSSPVLNFNDRNLTVYFGSSDGNLYALDARAGKKKWAFRAKGIIHSSPALYNGVVYFGSFDTYLYALDAASGRLNWKFKTGDQPVLHQMEGIQASPTCYKGSVYFGCRDAHFYSLDANTGKLKWKVSTDGSWVLTTAAFKDGTLYISTSDSYLFMALDAKTGKEKFRFKANGYIYSSAAISGNTAYFGDFSGKLFALNLLSGKPISTFATPERIHNSRQLLNKDNIDFIYLIKSKDTMAYATSVAVMDELYKLGPIVSSPAISDGVIYFGSADGYVYAIDLMYLYLPPAQKK